MEITAVKENLVREFTPAPIQKPADKPETPKPRREPESPEAPKIDLKKNEEAIKALSENLTMVMKSMRYSLQFIPDRESGQVIIKVLDGEGNLVRRIPPESMFSLSGRIGQSIGIILNETLE